MNTVEIDAAANFALGCETVVHLPSGLLGFEHFKKYLVQGLPGEEPFYRVKVLEEPAISFIAVSPFEVMPEYQPDLPMDEVRLLGIECPDDVFLLNVVTLRSKGRATVNLKGPIVINRFSLLGRQVVLSNAVEYSVQHPLPTE